MAKEAVKQFLELIEKDTELQDKVRGLDAEQTVAFAKENGFDVTFDELEEAIKEIHSNRKQGAVELDLEQMDKVAGGTLWFGEDAPDGHELGCMISYHQYNYQKERNLWCKSNHYCQGNIKGSKGGVPKKI